MLPQNFTAKVDKDGVAEVKISLLSNAAVLRQIANRLNSPEGATHEFYVTARHDGKIKGASRVNVNVNVQNADDKTPTKKNTEKENSSTVKQTKPHSAIFPGTSRVKPVASSEKKSPMPTLLEKTVPPFQKSQWGTSLQCA